LFTINHYNAYDVIDAIVVDKSFILQDQFGTTTHNQIKLDFFSTPVIKNNESIPDPIAHLSWWRLLDGTFSPPREVIVRNQYGESSLSVFDAEYLLAPALKNQGTGAPPLDDRDHYKCYRVEGAAPGDSVLLTDQFNAYGARVREPAYLCNPVEKRLGNGQVFGVSKPDEHLVCYNLFLDFDVSGLPVMSTDQFFIGPLNLGKSRYLCVPSEKEEVVQVDEEKSWGKLKSIYR